MASRIFLCFTAACCCLFCLALLPPPVQGRPTATGGLQAAGGFGGRRLHHLLPVPEPRFLVPAEAAAEEEQRRGVPVMTNAKARPAAWSVRPELRAVPGGPDPLHHHGGSPSRRPEQDRTPSP